MTRNTKQNPQPLRYSKNVRQAIKDRILTFSGTRTSHLSQIRSLRSFPVLHDHWYFVFTVRHGTFAPHSAHRRQRGDLTES